MTANELNKLVGQNGTYKIGDLRISILVVNARTGPWQRTDVQISPVSGEGMQWVRLDSVTLKGS
jgi:hypothetical protein